jgi:hypothetical protein
MSRTQVLMNQGMTLEQAIAQQEIEVFGHGFKRDASGKPIEQGRPLDKFHQDALDAAKRQGLE